MHLGIYGKLFLIKPSNIFIKPYKRFFHSLGSYWERNLQLLKEPISKAW